MQFAIIVFYKNALGNNKETVKAEPEQEVITENN
jgi:hypothetical protein